MAPALIALALLAAVLWCEADDSTRNTSVDGNLLRDAWLGVSLDALLPDDPAAYGSDDGVLAGAALGPLIVDVAAARWAISTGGAELAIPGMLWCSATQ